MKISIFTFIDLEFMLYEAMKLFSYKPNVAIERLVLLIHIWEVLSSSLSLEITSILTDVSYGSSKSFKVNIEMVF
jgi:hypothetical protein